MKTTPTSRDLRIVFLGTPDFAVGVLQALVEAGKNIVGVITAPDRPAGRGRKLRPSAVKAYAESQELHILQPTNLKNEDFLKELAALNANLQIIVAFRMLPKVVWQMPEYGTFNLHASLLPQYRGAAPIHWAIVNGERTTGVTTFFIDEKIDTGAIIDSSEVNISPRETVGSLHDTLMSVGSKLVLETVEQIAQDTAIPKAQPDHGTLRAAPKLTPDNTKIDWNWSLVTLDHFIRGLSQFPTAWTMLHNDGEPLKMKLYAATPIKEDHDLEVGSIIATKNELKIMVKEGYLLIEQLQLPGKRKMDAKSLLNGFNFESKAKVV